MPVALILSMTALSVENSPSALNSISKLSLVPTSIAPPESSLPVSFASLKLSLVHVAFFSSPVVYPAALFFIKPKLSQVIISSRKVKLSLSLQLPIMEVSVDNLVSAFEEANSFSMRSVDFCLSDIDYFWILEEFWVIKSWLDAQDYWRTVFYSQQLLESQLNISQFPPDEACFIVQIVKVKLCFFQHLFF